MCNKQKTQRESESQKNDIDLGSWTILISFFEATTKHEVINSNNACDLEYAWHLKLEQTLKDFWSCFHWEYVELEVAADVIPDNFYCYFSSKVRIMHTFPRAEDLPGYRVHLKRWAFWRYKGTVLLAHAGIPLDRQNVPLDRIIVPKYMKYESNPTQVNKSIRIFESSNETFMRSSRTVHLHPLEYLSNPIREFLSVQYLKHSLR